MRLRPYEIPGLSILFFLIAGFAFAQGGDTSNQGGIKVDPKGVLTYQVVEKDGQLVRQQRDAAVAKLPLDLQRDSSMRMISLKALEKEVERRDGRISDDMRYLAGLTRIEYVFYYPESKEIVIAGPAGPWAAGMDGTVLNASDGRPILQLDDLVVALRMFPPSGKSTDLIGCSIDPTQEGIARLNRFTSSNRVVNTPEQRMDYADEMVRQLGLNEITIHGVPENTQFAQILVAADYRMKLIGLGLAQKPARNLKTYYELARVQQIKGLIRWFLVPDYDCVRVTEDGNGMQLIGNSVKLVEEGEKVAADGSRTAKNTGSGNGASMGYVASFTKEYPEIAKNAPVFGQLRNLIDLSVCAAYIQKEGFYKEADWNMSTFGDETKFKTGTCEVPKFVESTVNIKTIGRQTAYPISGGVTINPARAIDPKNVTTDEKGTIEKAREKVLIELKDGQWWWDAK